MTDDQRPVTVSTTLEIGAQPGALRVDYTHGAWTDPSNYLAEPDWEPGDSSLTLEDCSHGGSIAQITVAVSPHDDVYDGQPVPTVEASIELTPEDVLTLIKTLRLIHATIEPEMVYEP